MKYFTFGMKKLRVTQSYNEGNHLPHWKDSKDFADYPIDIAGKDENKDEYFLPVDMKIVNIKGIGTATTNTIWLVALEKCITPSGEFTPFIMLTHFEDNDKYINKYKIGDIVKAGNPICLEGTDGNVKNHLHMSCGNADLGLGNDMILNSNGKWVTNGYSLRPEEVMYIDREFTEEIWGGYLPWKDKPTINLNKATNEELINELSKRLK